MSVYTMPIMDVYQLLKISKTASPIEIMEKCKQYCAEWSLSAVQHKLSRQMSREEAAVCAADVWKHGKNYLNSLATVLLDPSARQCYDAWLEVKDSGSPEMIALTRARIQWFNSMSTNVRFSENMLKCLDDTEVQPKPPPMRELSSKPICRQCQCPFDFNSPYLVLHCDCTTRVGHVSCIKNFSARVKHKCPVCRQRLLQRHQVSKYLFWNVKEKFKFIA